MTEVIPKMFEEDEDRWAIRHENIIHTIKSLDNVGINFNSEVLKEMSKDEKEEYFNILAYKICKHEWEEDAI